jgi:hypothetical protein
MTKDQKIKRLLAEDRKLAPLRKFQDFIANGRIIATADEQKQCVAQLRGSIWCQLRRLGYDP